MGTGVFLGDGESKTGAAGGALARGICPPKTVKHPGGFLLAHADTPVADRHRDRGLIRVDNRHNRLAVAVVDGVTDEVQQHPANTPSIGVDDAVTAENLEQQAMHEKAYNNNVDKVKHASKKLAGVREKIKRYEADLKMSNAEAELARLSQSFNFDVTTDFGELEMVIQEKIDLNRAAVRVASDLSEEGMETIEAEKALEESMADDLLTQFEVDMGLKTAETADIIASDKSLGPVEAQEDALADVEKELETT